MILPVNRRINSQTVYKNYYRVHNTANYKTRYLHSITVVDSPQTKKSIAKMNEKFEYAVDDLWYWAIILFPALFAFTSTRKK